MGFLGGAWAKPTLSLAPQQRFQDTSQYVCAELQALEQEQRQIDGRAAEVEKQLRSLMESGGRPESTRQHMPPHLAHSAALSDPERSREDGGWGHHPPLPLGTLRPAARKQLAGGTQLWFLGYSGETTPPPHPLPPSVPAPDRGVRGWPGDCPGLIQVPTGCRRRY